MISFLGYVISAQGVQMDNDKVKAVTDWPTPALSKNYKGFLGSQIFTSDSSVDSAQLLPPLTSLLQGKPKLLKWNEATETAFVEL